MKHIVEAGTDAASLLLFDPGALPADFEHKMKDGAFELLEQLTKEGKAYWINTDGDGGYLLHAYVGEPVPGSLREYSEDPIVVERFAVPTGTVYFTGGEYGFRDDPTMLKKYPHMGGCFQIAPGFYRLTLFRTDYPDGLLEKHFRDRVSAVAYGLYQRFGWLVASVLVSWVAVLVAFYQVSLGTWLRFWLPIGLFAPLFPYAASRLPAYRRAQDAWGRIQRDFPSVVAEMEAIT